MDYQGEFNISGQHNEVVTKVRDFEDRGWVIPVSGSLRMMKGGVYRWTLHILKKCQHRPQMQFGVHGEAHEKPWRLVTTSRCSRSRDDDPWKDRPGGDKLIDEGDQVHVVCDMRGDSGGHAMNGNATTNATDTTPNNQCHSKSSKFGTFGFAINDGPFELVFDDIPLDTVLMPVVSMGG